MLGVAGLPEPEYIDTGFDPILSEMLDLYETYHGDRPTSGSQEYNFLSILAYRENLVRVAINDAARQNLLAFAAGEKLDYIGRQIGVTRLQASPASVVVRFVFSSPLPESLIIPAGTEISDANDTVVFATTQTIAASPGALNVEVATQCTTPGGVGNGWAVGSLNTLFVPIAYVQSVENIEISAGGSDAESDDAYRDRIYITPEQFSTAGSVGAYEYWTKSVNPDIVDVAVSSPYPGQVSIVALLSGGEAPTNALLEEIRLAVNASDRRPITDTVSVSAPSVVSYDVAMDVYVAKSSEHVADDVVAGVEAAVRAYADTAASRLGTHVVPERIIAAAQQVDGVYRAVCSAPTYTTVGPTEVARLGAMTVTTAGIV